MIAIVNCGLGNIKSIENIVTKVGGKSVLVTNSNDLTKYNKILLPGVGHYAEGVRALKNLGMWDVFQDLAKDQKIFILGICLGMQLLCNHSEEGDVEGLGLVDAQVKKFNFGHNKSLKVPHMGWNTLKTVRENPLLPMDDEERRFYFVHSYKVVPTSPGISIGKCNYGGDFCGAFQRDNIFGVQFHPEKSHKFGMALIKRFVELY